jgi:hypothetical protein
VLSVEGGTVRGILLGLLAASGCGFHAAASPDLSPGADLSASVDLGTAVVDQGLMTDLASGDLARLTGPGPLGALPTGYCCVNTTDCRSRRCIAVQLGTYFCSEFCERDTDCDTGFHCDTAYNSCVPSVGAGCIDPAVYNHGTLPTGACCAWDDDCLGGRCTRTGNAANPFYCTQGCSNNAIDTPCPSGFTCTSADNGYIDLRFCQQSQALLDDNFLYTCQ